MKVIDDYLSPSIDIDVFWHQFILDTKAYYNYCIDKCDKIIHHYPRNAINKTDRHIRYVKTLKLYVETYNRLINLKAWSLSQCSKCSITTFDHNFITTYCKNDVCLKCMSTIKKCIHCKKSIILKNLT